MFSYWEQKNFFNYDLIVVGAGFTGFSTAIHFKEKFPKAGVLILERGLFPTGASTKNAGFACFGSLTEILDDLWHMTQSEVLALVEKRYRGLTQIRKVFGDKSLRYVPSGGFELIQKDQLEALDQLEHMNALLSSIFEKKVFSLVKQPEMLGFSEGVKAIVKNRFEGELDPGAYLLSLWQKASQLGIQLLTGSEVLEVEPNEGKVLVTTGFQKTLSELKAGKIAICTNAFTQKIWPKAELEPGRGLVLVSEQLGMEFPWKGTFHYDKGYVYFREVDGRLLLGGGRNQDFSTEKTTEFEVNPKIRAYLTQIADEIIFPFRKVVWEKEWTGIMAFGKKKVPILEPIGSKTAVGVRLGGMGVAIGWEVGKDLSSILSEL
ncbi:NAD(P)/FAD-dependent oxidoreductase [Algoriphagus sanaruensis]|uniref:FAD-dependent oxidoreductase n=1 Tax=Algoriphagus sanaruensis TaxID=1727163 RepID=A0A142ERF8_9BACT|nr:FAD-dependent oxidoreductase [Algoriphagus sanaruensis]AMQ57713.1 FAD-dependent oxidoreductase [Algoriphagus sanaruensis]